MKKLKFSILLSSILALTGCITNDDLLPLIGDLGTKSEPTVVNGPLGNSALVFNPTALNFGSIVVNSVSPLEVVTVKNSSAFTLVLGATTGATSAITIIGNTCTSGTELPAGATCTISMEFAPTANNTYNTIISVDYTTSAATGTFNSVLNVTGSGTTLVGFGGLTSISNVSSTKMKLNWTGVAGAATYDIFRINGATATLVSSQSPAIFCLALVCDYTITGLTPNTAYTYRVRARDSAGITEENIINRAATTGVVDTFVTGTLSTTEGITGTLDLDTVCSNLYSGGRVYALTSQTSASASPNCSIVGTNLSCTPPYINKSGTHAAWSESATLSCTVDGNILSQTFTIAVTGSTIVPTAADSTVVASPASITADGTTTSTITVTLKDAANVKSAGRTVTLTSSRGATDTISAASGLSSATGVVTFTVKSTTAGAPTFTAVDTTDAVTITQQATVTFIPGAVDHLEKTAGDAQLATVNTNVPIPPKVRTVDRYGNGVSGVSVAFFPIQGGGQASAYKVVSDASGYAQVNFRLGSSDTVQKLEVTRVGSMLPDVAASGNARVTFTETANNSGNGTFNSPMNNTGGAGAGSVYSMSSGDFNGDGKKDVVVPLMNQGAIRVFLGNGDGTFQTGVDYSTGSNSPTYVAIADLNGDTYSDFVVANWANSKMSVFMGNGNGTFQAKVDYATGGPNSNCVALGDLNGDGKLDAVVTNSSGNNFSVFLGNGNGTFNAKTDTAFTGPYFVLMKDMNADGKLDLIMSNHGTSVNIFIGNGNGTFAAPVSYATAGGSDYLVVEDMNADGKWDVLVTNYFAGVVYVFIGNGDGTLQARVSYTVGTTPGQIVMKDLNGDGALDIVCPNAGTHTISVLLGNKTAGAADGTFAAKVDYSAGYKPRGMTIQDFDADGSLDVAFVSDGQPYRFGLLQGLGNGTFKVKNTTNYATNANPYYMASADLNADGKLDLVVANYTGPNLSVYIGNGDGTFQPKVDYVASNPYKIVIGDFNEDGAMDLASTGYSTGVVSIFLGNLVAGVPNGTFAARVDYSAGSNPRTLEISDFNRDGHLDLVVTNYLSANVSVFTGVGDGTFNLTNTVPANLNPGWITVADFNVDGKKDFLVSNYSSNNMSMYLGNGDGTFQTRSDIVTGNGPAATAFGDFNADGKLDVISANNSAQNYNFFSGNADGTFAAPTSTTAGVNASSVKSADFNNDGKLDFVIVNSLSNHVDIALGNGNGTFQTLQSYNTDLVPLDVIVADFNGDGKLDLVTGSTGSSTIKVNLGK